MCKHLTHKQSFSFVFRYSKEPAASSAMRVYKTTIVLHKHYKHAKIFPKLVLKHLWNHKLYSWSSKQITPFLHKAFWVISDNVLINRKRSKQKKAVSARGIIK